MSSRTLGSVLITSDAATKEAALAWAQEAAQCCLAQPPTTPTSLLGRMNSDGVFETSPSELQALLQEVEGPFGQSLREHRNLFTVIPTNTNYITRVGFWKAFHVGDVICRCMDGGFGKAAPARSDCKR